MFVPQDSRGTIPGRGVTQETGPGRGLTKENVAWDQMPQAFISGE